MNLETMKKEEILRPPTGENKMRHTVSNYEPTKVILEKKQMI